MNSDNLITAVLALRKARRVVVYTGAGVFAESGIPTFRDADGFWQRFPPEQFAQWSGLFSMVLSEPRRVAEFVLNVVEPIAMAKPNAGHLAIRDTRTVCADDGRDPKHRRTPSSRRLERSPRDPWLALGSRGRFHRPGRAPIYQRSARGDCGADDYPPSLPQSQYGGDQIIGVHRSSQRPFESA